MISSYIACISCVQLFIERLLEKSTRQSRKLLWVVLSSLFSKKFERVAHMFTSTKGSKKIKFDSYSVRNSVLILSHTTFRDCRLHICCLRSLTGNLSRNSCIQLSLAVSKAQGLK